jgi:hypothetical protein
MTVDEERAKQIHEATMTKLEWSIQMLKAETSKFRAVETLIELERTSIRTLITKRELEIQLLKYRVDKQERG